jgi:hypothetical protein
MPRYFFTIQGQDRAADDPEGTYLPDAAAALSYAEYTIRELRKKERLQRSGSDDVRKGSSAADGFVIAVFSGLLNASHCQRNEGPKDSSEHRRAAGAIESPSDVGSASAVCAGCLQKTA